MQTTIQPTAEQQIRLRRLAEWDLSLVRSVAIRHGMSEANIDEAITEYRKFIALHIFDGRRNFVMSEPVDPVWHSHILCTRDYERFCNEVLGRFLHHLPTKDEGERKQLTGTYREGTRALMRQVFGGLDEKWWGKDSPICFDPCQSGGSPIDEMMEMADERYGNVVHGSMTGNAPSHPMT